MPLIRLDVIKGRSKEELKKLLDTVYQVASEEFHLREHDRFQIVTQHDPSEMIIEDVGLGFKRTDKFVMISITSSPRKESDKEHFYARLAKDLQEKCGIDPQDIMVNFTFNTPSDWSFGEGEAQYLNGKL